MSAEGSPLLEQIRAGFRSPFVPEPFERLALVSGYLEHVWPQLAPSVGTTGFLNSALYMADMALDTVEEVYEPVLSRDALLAAGSLPTDLDAIAEVVDLFHYVQPQVLLALAALTEAMTHPMVGGHGRPEPRPTPERESMHLAVFVPRIDSETAPLPEIAGVLGVGRAPDLYRALAAWPSYLAAAWDEIQHLASYPDFRRRGRALYYYARSGARFLARPIEAGPDALRLAGLDEAAITEARMVLEGALPLEATMMMHAEAIRLMLGSHRREVVQRPDAGRT